MSARPRIVCLCGSTRFVDAFQRANLTETLAGRIVLSVGFFGPRMVERQADWDAVKPRLDELHKRKIDLADEVFVLNVGRYVGSSTRSEIEYARQQGKPVRFLEAESQRRGGHTKGLKFDDARRRQHGEAMRMAAKTRRIPKPASAPQSTLEDRVLAALVDRIASLERRLDANGIYE